MKTCRRLWLHVADTDVGNILYRCHWVECSLSIVTASEPYFLCTCLRATIKTKRTVEDDQSTCIAIWKCRHMARQM